MPDKISPKDRLKIINEYLNEKPPVKSKGGFWNSLFGFLAIAAKGYLRYSEIKGKK